MTETLVPNGDADDYIQRGLGQIARHANSGEQPGPAETHPIRDASERPIDKVAILAGRAGLQLMPTEQELAPAFRLKERRLPYSR